MGRIKKRTEKSMYEPLSFVGIVVKQGVRRSIWYDSLDRTGQY